MKTYTRWIVGQDTTDLVAADGRVIHSLPSWTSIDKNAIGLAMLRATPKHNADTGIHRADSQPFTPQSATVEQISRALSRSRRA